jgi:hypothetical protein
VNIHNLTSLAVELADTALWVHLQPNEDAMPEAAALAALDAIRQHLEPHGILHRVEGPGQAGEPYHALIIPLPCRA